MCLIWICYSKKYLVQKVWGLKTKLLWIFPQKEGELHEWIYPLLLQFNSINVLKLSLFPSIDWDFEIIKNHLVNTFKPIYGPLACDTLPFISQNSWYLQMIHQQLHENPPYEISSYLIFHINYFSIQQCSQTVKNNDLSPYHQKNTL